MKPIKLCLILIILLGSSVILSLSITAIDQQLSSFSGQTNPFNITFSGNQNQSHILSIPSYAYVKNLTLSLFQGIGLCYQEQANISTSCSTSNGYYSNSSVTGTMGKDFNFCYDGNYSSSCYPDAGSTAIFNIIYYKTNFTRALWQIKTDTISINLTIPNDCFNAFPNYLNLSVSLNRATGPDIQFRCNNNSNNLTSIKTVYLNSGANEMYEEGIIWNNGITSNITIYLNNQLQYNTTEFFNLINLPLNNTLLNLINMNNSQMNLTIQSSTLGILQVNLTNATYSYGIDNCSNSFNIPSNASSLNISFYDEKTSVLINADSNGIFNYLSNSYSFSTVNKNKIEFCSYPNWFNATVTGNIYYSKDGYASKQYFLEDSTSLIFSNISQTLSLFLSNLSDTTLVKINWLTNQYISVTGTLYVYKCDGTGNKTLVETSSILNGVSYVNLNLLNTIYSYSVLYNGVLYEDLNGYSKCHIESASEISYYINVETNNALQPIGLLSVICNLTKPTNTTVKMSWSNNPNSDLPITGCLLSYRNDINGWTLTSSDCVNDSYSITRNVPYTGYNYEIRGKLYQGGYSISCDQPASIYDNNTPAQTFGLSGLLSVVFLVLSCALYWAGDDTKMNIGAIIGVVIAWIFGILNFDWKVISAICAFIIIIMLVGRSASKR